jgi:LemA protein
MRGRQFSRLMPFAALIAAAFLLSGCGVNTIPTLEQDAKANRSAALPTRRSPC